MGFEECSEVAAMCTCPLEVYGHTLRLSRPGQWPVVRTGELVTPPCRALAVAYVALAQGVGADADVRATWAGLGVRGWG